MGMIEERLHIFDTVRQYLYEHDDYGPKLPEWQNPIGFEISKRKALELNRLGILGEFYYRIVTNKL